jgi:ubiquinone/menaquinone biosynthesis C-methylase UbiE
MPQKNISLDERIVQLLRHLGVKRAHFAGCMPRDWESLVANHAEVVASLTLICPMGINVALLLEKNVPCGFQGRSLRADTRINVALLLEKNVPLLCIAGDSGRPGTETAREIKKLPAAHSIVLRDYFSPPWADPIADRREEIGKAIIEFISRSDTASLQTVSETSGEVSEISYRIVGNGAPLILMPLALAPSQWEPLIATLSQHFSTITLGGAHLGMVAHLETRARSGYLRVVDQLINELQLAPGQSVLEVGCGPGAIVRRIAQRTHGANSIRGVDVNRYLLREAAALAKRDGLDRWIQFQEADATTLPFPDHRFDATISCTVMEEGNADRMLEQFVRVTKRGGKVGAVVRSTDLPRWVNLPLSAELKRTVESPGFFSGNVSNSGCADASLYRRMNQAGLTDVVMMPQWASHKEGERLEYLHDRITSSLGDSELAEWQAAVAQVQSDGTFFIAEPFHCAVGTKP